jgi:hypothetical protein
MKEHEGLGDTIEAVTKAIGIKPCDGCKKRKEWVNKKTRRLYDIVFRRKKPDPDQQKNDWPNHKFD